MLLWLASLVISIIANVNIARRKDREVGLWVVLAIVFGLLSTVILALVPSNHTRPCPACKSLIPQDATRCRYCQSEVDPIPL